MGWTFETEPDHIQNFINDKLREASASAVHVANDPLTVTRRNLARDSSGATAHDFIEVWYLADSVWGGKPYFALLLLDYERNGKRNGHGDSGMVVNRHGDGGWPRSSPLVQAWGCKQMDASMRPSYYGCPLEYLDAVPARSKHEREWYDEVRRRAEERAAFTD